MRTSAIFLLIWTPVLEDAQEHVHGGMVFRNHPLAYWVDYVRHLGGADSPVLVVQTRCDRPQDEATCPVPEADLFEAFAFRKVLRYSARTDRGRAALDEALAEAADWLRQREGIAVIGAGRHRVQQRLEAMRDADAAVAPEARQYRTITQAHFHRLCDEAGGISSPDHLLAYLHNVGVVFLPAGTVPRRRHSRSGLGAGRDLCRLPSGEVLREDPPAAGPLYPLRHSKTGCGASTATASRSRSCSSA